MAKKRKTTRAGKHGAEARDDRRTAVLATSIEVMGWRLREAATRIDEAADAVGRDDPGRALDRLLEIEPLVFEVERVLSAVFLLARESGAPADGRPNSSPRKVEGGGIVAHRLQVVCSFLKDASFVMMGPSVYLLDRPCGRSRPWGRSRTFGETAVR